MDCIRFTTLIKWGYEGKELPKRFAVRSTRVQNGAYTSGNYTEYATLNGRDRQIPCEFLDYEGTGGVYYVKIFSIDKNGNEVGGSEFSINILDPSDSIVAPVGVRIVNNE
jgi:hypothetical protein